MLFVPALCAFVFYRDKRHGFEAFRQDAPYLFDPAAPGLADYDSGIRTVECTKRAATFGLWGVWSLFGRQLFTDMVDVTFDLGRTFYEKLAAADDFVPLHEPQCNIVVFRHVPDELRDAPSERSARSSWSSVAASSSPGSSTSCRSSATAWAHCASRSSTRSRRPITSASSSTSSDATAASCCRAEGDRVHGRLGRRLAVSWRHRPLQGRLSPVSVRSIGTPGLLSRCPPCLSSAAPRSRSGAGCRGLSVARRGR